MNGGLWPRMGDGVGAMGVAGRFTVATLAVAGLLACGAEGGEGPPDTGVVGGPPHWGWVSQDEAGGAFMGEAMVEDTVGFLVRGRLRPDTLVIQPAFQVDPPGEPPRASEGPHRIRGEDNAGRPLFEVSFEGTPVADLPDGPEEHFSFNLPIPAGKLPRLHRLVVESADGRTAQREATLSVQELEEALAAPEAVRAEGTADGRVRLRWDGDRLPWAMVRDAESGRIVGFVRQGEALVASEAATLEVVFSEGVRSAARTVPVDGR